MIAGLERCDLIADYLKGLCSRQIAQTTFIEAVGYDHSCRHGINRKFCKHAFFRLFGRALYSQFIWVLAGHCRFGTGRLRRF